jgi:hypothetical protein
MRPASAAPQMNRNNWMNEYRDDHTLSSAADSLIELPSESVLTYSMGEDENEIRLG